MSNEPRITPDPAFAGMFLDAMEHRAAAGELVDQDQMDHLRALHLDRDPACWLWPAPATCTFPDEDTAERFLRWWNRDCAICGAALDLVLDHDHKRSFIRGYLCRSCNVQEGRSDAGVYSKYRERNPATILGIKIRYFSPFTGYAQPEPEQAAADETADRAAVDRLHLPSPEDLAS